jgi:hypothetical protein
MTDCILMQVYFRSFVTNIDIGAASSPPGDDAVGLRLEREHESLRYFHKETKFAERRYSLSAKIRPSAPTLLAALSLFL